MKDESGQGMVENVFLLGILLVALVLGAILVAKRPDLANKSILLLLAGSLVAGIGWSAKQTIAMLNGRAQLLVVELLSTHTAGLERVAIEQTLKSDHFIFRLIPGLTIDALAHLVAQKTVTAVSGRYLLTDTART